MNLRCQIKTLFLLLFTISTNSVANDEYPFRVKFADVKIISIEKLREIYDDAIIIDIRSSEECFIVKINKAHCLPWSNKGFEVHLSDFRDRESDTPLVLYCNGYLCKKSYQAARIAIRNGFKNIFAMDSGAYEWAKRYPELTTFMGQTPLSPNDLISPQDFSKRSISFAELQKIIRVNPSVLIIDIREPRQKRNQSSLDYHFPMRSVPFNRMVDFVLKKNRWIEREIVIIDAVGKQGPWLQYYFERHGYQNYFFLKDGANNSNLQRFIKAN